MGAIAWTVQHELRARWRAVVGLALLVGLAGGLVLSAAAGARRTGSAYDRFVAATRTRDASVQVDVDDPGPLLDRIERLDAVARSGRIEIFPVLPDDESLHEGVDLALFVSPGGRWAADIDRPVVLAGRMPDPSSTREVLLNELAAGQTGLGVGDHLPVRTFTPEQLDVLNGGGPFQGFGGPAIDLRIVGIGRQATDLQGADISVGALLLGSPALHRELDGRAGSLGGLVGIELAEGATVGDLRDGVRRILGTQEAYEVRSADEEFASSTRDATRVLARALAAFAAVAAVATAVAVGGSLSRQCALARHDEAVLGALGCDRRQRGLVTAAVPGAGVALGTALAVALAVPASARFPISVAARVEPDPGVRVDVPVLAGGAAVLLAIGGACLVVAVRRSQRHAAPRAPRRAPTWRSLPPALAIGVGHALARRADDRAVPARAALAAATLGVVGVVGAAVVVHSFDRVVAEPARYGWAWSAEPDVYAEDPEALVDELVAHEGTAAVATRHSARVELADVVVQGLAFEEHEGVVEAPLRSGRSPASADEVVLGQRTADELGVGLGDRVPARTADGSAVDVEVVGIGVVAPVESTHPGSGAIVSMDGLELLRRSDGFRSLLVRYAPGFDPSAFEASLQERELADFSAVYARPRLPGGLVNLDRAMPIVTALGAFFVAVAVVGVGHAVVVGTRRRRRELASLHALGMRRAQVRSVVVASALTTVAVGVVVGVPLGLAVGRLAWRVVIDSQAVLDDPALPLLALAGLLPGALVVGLLVSWRPSAAGTRRAAAALRSE